MRGRCLQSPRKQRYNSQTKALAAARQLETSFNRTYHAYRCAGCNGWHLTTKQQDP